MISRFPLEETWRLFIDGAYAKFENGWSGFERREKNYLKSMMKSFAFALSYKGELNIPFIKKLHALCMENVNTVFYKNGRFGTYHRGEFRNDSENDRPYLDLSRLVTESIATLYYYFEVLWEFRFLCLKLSEKGDSTTYILIADRGIHFSDDSPSIQFNPDNKNLFLKLSKEKLDAVIKNNKSPHIIEYSCLSSDEKTFEEVMENILLKYHQEINRYDVSSDERFDIIIRLIRIFCCLHPFHDGNTRIFAMILLNYLLYKNGFQLTLQEDPNIFDHALQDQVKKEVIIGQGKFSRLSENKAIDNLNTKKIICSMKKRDKDYFFSSIKALAPFFRYTIPKSDISKMSLNHLITQIVKYALNADASRSKLRTYSLFQKNNHLIMKELLTLLDIQDIVLENQRDLFLKTILKAVSIDHQSSFNFAPLLKILTQYDDFAPLKISHPTPFKIKKILKNMLENKISQITLKRSRVSAWTR